MLASGSASGQIRSRQPVVGANDMTPASCPAPRDTVYDATIVLPSIARNARTAVVTICLNAATTRPGISSYAGRLTFPPGVIAFDSASPTLGGVRTASLAGPGVLRFAGSHPSGFSSGAILAVRLRLLRQGFLSPLGLTLADLRTLDGRSAMPHLWVQGRAPFRVEARRPGGGVRIARPLADSTPRLSSLDRVTVGSSQLSSGQVVTLTIFGSNFDHAGNIVMFGPVTIAGLASNGSTIKFAVPAEFEAQRGAPPMAMIPNEYQITVKTSHGTSNALHFRIIP